MRLRDAINTIFLFNNELISSKELKLNTVFPVDKSYNASQLDFLGIH